MDGKSSVESDLDGKRSESLVKDLERCEMDKDVQTQQPFNGTFGRQMMGDDLHILQDEPQAFHHLDPQNRSDHQAVGGRELQAPDRRGGIRPDVDEQVGRNHRVGGSRVNSEFEASPRSRATDHGVDREDAVMENRARLTRHETPPRSLWGSRLPNRRSVQGGDSAASAHKCRGDVDCARADDPVAGWSWHRPSRQWQSGAIRACTVDESAQSATLSSCAHRLKCTRISRHSQPRPQRAGSGGCVHSRALKRRQTLFPIQQPADGDGGGAGRLNPISQENQSHGRGLFRVRPKTMEWSRGPVAEWP